MFKPENHFKKPTDVTKPAQHFDNFYGGGYHIANQPKHMPRHEIINNPYQAQIDNLHKLLKQKDNEITKLRVKNEMLEEELCKANENLTKGQFLKQQAPLGFASPHPPYGNQ